MTVIVQTCLSSYLMSELLAWRNPLGREENWNLEHFDDTGHLGVFIGKVVTTEIGLACLTLTAIIEVIALSEIAFVEILFKYFNVGSDLDRCLEMLDSSLFTVIWAVADLCFFNLVFINVFTHESIARSWIGNFHPFLNQLFYRVIDNIYIDNLDQNRRIDNNQDNEDITNDSNIEDGANFLIDHVLKDVSKKVMEDFKTVDPDFNHMWLLIKAAYIYAIGSKRDDRIPDFFKGETKSLIRELREKPIEDEVIQEIERLVKDPDQFAVGAQSDSAKAVFLKLGEIAAAEIQGGQLNGACWSKAINKLPSPE